MLAFLLLCIDFDPRPNDGETRYWLNFLQEERAQTLAIGLENAAHYVNEFKPLFAEAGVPTDLVWLALIETSFVPTATSRTGAQGMYQFHAATARWLGMNVEGRQDERNVPHKAAATAAKYLARLRTQFDSWDLVLAAYNFGQGDLRRAMARHRARTWRQVKPYVREETQAFVGKVRAAVILGERYMARQTEPRSYSLYRVARGDSLEAIARRHGVTVGKLKHMNGVYDGVLQRGQLLAIPTEPGDFARPADPPPPHITKTSEHSHLVRRGETLFAIGRRYDVSIADLKAANGLRSDTLSIGQSLRIPINAATHVVKTGETLFGIARRYDLSIADLKAANNLQNDTIKVGQVLILP